MYNYNSSIYDLGNLGVNPIKTSASAPSVPESQQPVPPPRRSPPPQAIRPSTMNLGGSPNNKMNSQQQQQQQGVPTGSQVSPQLNCALNQHLICTKKVHNLQHCRKFMQKRCLH